MANIIEIDRINNIIVMGTTGTTTRFPFCTASRLASFNGDCDISSTDIASWITGTANQITVTDDGDGTVTLSIPSALAMPGKLTAGSFGSPLDVTATREYGTELHYSGNNYNATAIRARAHAVTTDTSAQFQGGLFQAANNDNINVGCLNGLVAEAIGKADTNAATITMMRGALVGAEWSAKDTVTDLRTLHVRTHTRDAATEGYVSGTGYGIYIENEAVGGNGQALDAGIYFKGTNLSGGNSAFDYGIDFRGGTYATAEIIFSDSTTISTLHTYVGRGDVSVSDFDEGDSPAEGAWTDLDLGPGGLNIVPTGAKAVCLFLRIKDDSVVENLWVRCNGYSATVPGNVLAIKTRIANVANYTNGVIGCDSNGVIEYYLDTGVNEFDITVTGWFI